jgi:hypothetical protein
MILLLLAGSLIAAALAFESNVGDAIVQSEAPVIDSIAFTPFIACFNTTDAGHSADVFTIDCFSFDVTVVTAFAYVTNRTRFLPVQDIERQDTTADSAAFTVTAAIRHPKMQLGDTRTCLNIPTPHVSCNVRTMTAWFPEVPTPDPQT